VTWTISRHDVDRTFVINASSGALRVGNHADIDFEASASYSIEVTMTDSGGLSASMDLVIQVLNVNEPPTTLYPSLFVLETALPGSVVCAANKVNTNDPDDTLVFTYKLKHDLGNGSSSFNISRTTGALSVSLNQQLDFETKSSYTLTVITTDQGLNDDPSSSGGTLSSTTFVFVTVLDVNEPPTLSVAEAYHVDEDAPQGT
jgi:hypothetical protein